MTEIESLKPDKIYRLWDSTKDLMPFSTWLPEVVGTAGELIRTGSVPINPPDVESAPYTPEDLMPEVRFIDADVTKYRNLLSIFRRRHRRRQ